MDAKCVFHFIGFLNYRKIILGNTKFLFNQKSTILINLIIESYATKSLGMGFLMRVQTKVARFLTLTILSSASK